MKTVYETHNGKHTQDTRPKEGKYNEVFKVKAIYHDLVISDKRDILETMIKWANKELEALLASPKEAN